MELIYSLAEVTVCPFLSKEHYEQCGDAGIGRGLKRYKNLAWFFGVPEDIMKIPTVESVGTCNIGTATTDAQSKIALVNCSSSKEVKPVPGRGTVS